MIREFRAYDVPNHKYWNNWSHAFLLSLEGEFLAEISGDAGGIEAIQPDPDSDRRFVFEQWTGMVDSKGKKIFEGDICRAIANPDYFPDDRPRPVIVAITIDFETPLSEQYGGGADGATTYSEVEVIGNIHDNPELIESQQEKLPCP